MLLDAVAAPASDSRAANSDDPVRELAVIAAMPTNTVDETLASLRAIDEYELRHAEHLAVERAAMHDELDREAEAVLGSSLEDSENLCDDLHGASDLTPSEIVWAAKRFKVRGRAALEAAVVAKAAGAMRLPGFPIARARLAPSLCLHIRPLDGRRLARSPRAHRRKRARSPARPGDDPELANGDGRL